MKDFLWSTPRLIKEHCQTVIVSAGDHVAGVIHSWYPEVKLDFVKDGFNPKANDEECHEYTASSVDVAELLVAKVNMDPQPDPIREEIGGASIEQVADQDPSEAELDIDQLGDEFLDDSSV